MFSTSVPQRAGSRRPFNSPPTQLPPHRPSVAPSIAHSRVVSSTYEGPRPFAQSPELTVKPCSQLPREVHQVIQTADLQRETWSGHIDHVTGFGFVLSPRACFVWKSSNTTTASTTCYIFPIPTAVIDGNSLHGRAPVGSLVPRGSSQEPGLIVGAATGEVRFWDSIGMGLSGGENYTSTNLPLAHSETLSSLYRCEETIYIVTTNLGRVFRLTISSIEGRLQLSSALFTKAQNAFSRLLFGSQPIGTSREGPTTIAFGEGNIRQGKDVWVANQSEIQRWRISLDGGEQRIAEIDIQGLFSSSDIGAISRAAFSDSDVSFDPSHYEVLDIAVVPEGILLLLSLSSSQSAYGSSGQPQRSYVLAHLVPTTSGEALQIDRVDLVPYGKEIDVRPATAPRINLLDGGSAAFIQFGDAITVASLAKGSTFHETLTLKSTRDRTMGFGFAKKDESGTLTCEILVITASSGVLSFLINKDNIKEFCEDTPTKQVKATLEQAVFLGSMPENPFLFTLSPRMEGCLDDASRAVSKEILSSRSIYLKPTLDLTAQLAGRLQNLRSLITFINENGVAGQLSLSGKHALSSDAEKLLAVSSLWSSYCQNPQKFGFLHHVMETHMRNVGEWNGSEDAIRAFCRTQVDSLDDLLVEVYNLARAMPAHNLSQRQQFAELLPAVNRTVLLVYDALICHRRDTSVLYGIRPEDHLMPSWTSESTQLELAHHLFNVTVRLLSQRMSEVGNGSRRQNDGAVAELTELRHQMKDLAYVVFYVFQERVDHLKAAALEGGNDRELKKLEEQFANLRPDVIRPLVQREWSSEAFSLAEKYRDFRLLTELSTDHTIGSDAKVQYYIERYGDEFAFKLYEWYGETGQLKKLFSQDDQHNLAVSRFLKINANPRVSWLHNLRVGESDEASKALTDEAAGEHILHAKKTMLSIGKLCILSGVSQADVTEEFHLEIRDYDDQLDLISVHERLRGKFQEIIGHHQRTIPQSSSDVAAKLCPRSIGNRPAFQTHFQRLAKKLFQGKVLDSEELIDILTLKKNDEKDLNGFTEGLEVLSRVQDVQGPRFETALKTIWRRALTYNDWEEFRRLPNLTDDQLADHLRQTALYMVLSHVKVSEGVTDNLVLRPHQAVGTPAITEISARFPQLSGLQVEEMVEDYMAEDAQLENFLQEPASLEDLYEEVAKLVDADHSERAL